MRFSVSYRARSHFATAVGSKRTHVPTRKEGIRPAFAILKIVAREIANNRLSSSAVRAWPVCAIWSASVHWLSTSIPVLSPKNLLPDTAFCVQVALWRVHEKLGCPGMGVFFLRQNSVYFRLTFAF